LQPIPNIWLRQPVSLRSFTLGVRIYFTILICIALFWWWTLTRHTLDPLPAGLLPAGARLISSVPPLVPEISGKAFDSGRLQFFGSSTHSVTLTSFNDHDCKAFHAL
jgi:hypothetical protein